MKKPLVSIIIPTLNSSAMLTNCLRSIKNQTYKNIETIIVDSKSTDTTLDIARKFNAIIYKYVPKVQRGKFDAPHKRNFGVKKAKGEYVYYLDADMELTKHVINDAVSLCEKGFDAVIIPEDSFGKGVWAKAKNLERRCYWGDDSIEAPRFFKRSVWESVGGLDESLGGGGDDWDLYQKVLEKGYKVNRIRSIVMHNEGELELGKLFKKRFMYGRDSVRYISKRPRKGIGSYFPIRRAYIKNWKLFIKRPGDTVAFILMRTVEYAGGFSGMIYTAFKPK